MNVLAKILLLPILILMFMIGWLMYFTGDKKHKAELHAQAEVIIKEGIRDVSKK